MKLAEKILDGLKEFIAILDRTYEEDSEDNESDKVAELEKKVKAMKLPKFSTYDGYSGRGMMGNESPFAFTTTTQPGSDKGKQLVALGFAVDNMGKDFIYYLKY